MIALIDSNIIIDFFAGKLPAVAEVTRYDRVYVSVISYVEVMTGLSSSEEIEQAAQFFAMVELIEINKAIAEESIKIRARNKIKLPDALILATSVTLNLLLITRDEGPAFKNHSYVRYPYKI